MKRELLHVLYTIKEPSIMRNFMESLTIDEKETLAHLLDYATRSVQDRWSLYL